MAFALALVAAPAAAQENLTLFALGGIACVDWIHPPGFANAGLNGWLLRYVGDIAKDGGFRSDPLAGITSEKMLAWVDAYCQAHPLTGLNVAGVTLVNELSAGVAGKQ